MKEKCLQGPGQSRPAPRTEESMPETLFTQGPGRPLGTRGRGWGSVGRGAGFKWCKARTKMTFCPEGSTLQITMGAGEKEKIIFVFNRSKRAWCQ